MKELEEKVKELTHQNAMINMDSKFVLNSV
jgi:hypothetical protein